MRAIIVCVDYSDLLEITLERNIHHFDEVMIVTSNKDLKTRAMISNSGKTRLFVTDLFYENGAVFNKWLALEAGLDLFGRWGWICLMDADVIWPKVIRNFHPMIGRLYSPLRRMYNPIKLPVPKEEDWKNYPIHRNIHEFAGYTQIFHAEDRVLGEPPWHEVCWKHAGGADSFFQRKWIEYNKIRPNFEVLHLGEAGKNWFGRATPYLNGELDINSEQRQKLQKSIWHLRRKNKDPNFTSEKIS